MPARMSADGGGGKPGTCRSFNRTDKITVHIHRNAVYDAQLIMARLEEAGRALLALPPSGYSTGLRMNVATLVRCMIEAGGSEPEHPRIHPPVPSAAGITRMDQALGWIQLIPRDRSVLRRIVGARALVNPLTDRHLYPWRRLGTMLGADHKAVQRWHAQGVDIIVSALNAAA